MIYKVSALYKKEKLGAFFKNLSNGSISSQKPDGQEIVASMKRAKITEPGVIEWFEICFCSPPLKHEKATVYNKYLTAITTEPVSDYGKVDGDSFWAYLNTDAIKDEEEK